MAWLDQTTTVASPQDVKRAARNLRKSDPVLAALIDSVGPCTLSRTDTYFQILIETILSQQLSTAVARVFYQRVIALLGGRKPTPGGVLKLTRTDLLSAGLSRSKAAYVHNVADAFASGALRPSALRTLPDEKVIERLTEIKGIGEWSAHMFLIFGLLRMDVFPVGDLGLRNAMAKQYRLRRPPSEKRLHEIGDKWRPYRTIGTWYLWASYDA